MVLIEEKMANRLLSDHERIYIERGVKENIRADGRTHKDYRHFQLTTGTVSNTSGSSEIKLVCNDRDDEDDNNDGLTTVLLL